MNLFGVICSKIRKNIQFKHCNLAYILSIYINKLGYLSKCRVVSYK